MDLKIGLSPCPNDTYILGALLGNTVARAKQTYTAVFQDVEQLNEMAMRQELPVTKLSYHAYYHVCQNYDLLDVGSAMGYGNGPLLVATQAVQTKKPSDWVVGLPGALTTAHALFSMVYPKVKEKKHMLFSEIPNALQSGQIDVGVIIHETRFLYEDMGLKLIEDLGVYWERHTQSPIPLGCFAVHKDLGSERAHQVNADIKASIQAADGHPEALLPYIQSHAQEKDPQIITAHIRMFVNDFSLHIDARGKSAINALFAALNRNEGKENRNQKVNYDIIV